MRTHSKAAGSTSRHPEAMWYGDGQAVEVATKTYLAWFDQASRIRDEALRFAEEQFTKELEAVLRLARCTTPTDAIAIQSEWANAATAECLAEGRKMVELVGEMARGMLVIPGSGGAQH